MKTLVYPARIDAKRLFEAGSEDPGSSICGIIARDEKDASAYRAYFPNKSIYVGSEISASEISYMETASHIYFEKAQKCLLEDYRTILIFERFLRAFGLRSSFTLLCQIERICWNAIRIIDESSPDVFIFQATPHEPVPWVFAKVSEMLGVRVYYTNVTFMAQRVVIRQGIDAQLLVESPGVHDETYADFPEKFYADRRLSYKDAMPEYERKKYSNAKGKHLSIGQEIKNIFAAPRKFSFFKLVASLRKLKAYKFLKQKAILSIPQNHFIVFFLHYQPERTTLPEGGWFVQQLFAIRALSRMAVRHGFEVVVKEHPSMFFEPWNIAVRDLYFYEAIDSLPNCSLCSLDMDPFLLIDSAIASATITGSVIYESLARGRPVIAFGNIGPPYLDGLFVVSGISDAEKAFHEIWWGKGTVDHCKNIEEISGMFRSSYAIEDSNSSAVAYWHVINKIASVG